MFLKIFELATEADRPSENDSLLPLYCVVVLLLCNSDFILYDDIGCHNAVLKMDNEDSGMIVNARRGKFVKAVVRKHFLGTTRQSARFQAWKVHQQDARQ